jgi:tetratricopeptide (TPR) repeat protein
MLQKVIVQGNLHFGKQKSYDKAVRMFHHRVDNYYKSDLLFKEEEELFQADQLSLEIPRTVTHTSDKFWKNTVDILAYLAQFALSGKICAWMINEGNILDYHLIEPDSEKTVVRNYKKGKKLSKKSGKEDAAMKALTKAIQKHDEHSQAYERRGQLNLFLKNANEALHDFSKAINIDDTNAEAFYGRGKVYMSQNSYEKAIEDFENTAKHALALQSLYWMARRNLAECYMQIGDYKKAAFNLKLFTRRSFDEDDPNKKWNQWAFFKYGKTLMQLEKYNEAAKAFDKALSIEEGDQGIPRQERLTFRGIAKLKSGSKGYLSDWKEAAEMGYQEAESLLKEHA